MMSDQRELLEQETMGIMQNKNRRAFAPDVVKRFLGAERVSSEVAPREVFLAIDPNGGGNSDFALVSTYFDRGTMVIAGFESINSKGPEDHNPLVLHHAERLQTRWPDTTLVFIIENNLGFEAKHIHNFLKKRLTGKVVYMREAEHVGFHTDHKLKELMYSRFNEWLTRDSIRFDSMLFAVNPDCAEDRVMRGLEEQLHTYSIITDLPKTPFGKIKVTYSGKVSAGAKDDVLVTMQLTLCWFDQFYKDPQYAVYR
jgi:hypothetical protein